MKEQRFFFVPDAATEHELPPDEAAHALRVLRLREGDEIMLMDGFGTFFRAEVESTASKHCTYRILDTQPQQPAWHGHIHLAMGPTKMMDRVEWFAEKATEIGVDELSFLLCKFSDRRQIKTERIEKIVVSAVKQSRKAWMPVVNPLVPFKDFIAQPRKGRCFIAHCYEEIPRRDLFNILNTPEILGTDDDLTILIGPEGDFSIDEVRLAVANGYESITLGSARLRTETAALSAVMMAQLVKRKK
ncbi:MAG: 16S rRNA (uracil(1498)-N(3))-methyltransferase [Prevotella sp.]|nr:16S rRNA (uracil(1498)-N(3))-methyltransferase [Prevotella sp.]